MTSEKPLIDAQLYSWKELNHVLPNLGTPPYINFSNKPVNIQSKKPQIIMVNFSEYEVSNEYQFTTKKYGAISYHICGTSVPPMSRIIYNKERLIQKIIEANVLNAFSQINPQFFSFFNAYRLYRDHRKLIADILDPYVTGFSEYFYLKLKDPTTLKRKTEEDLYFERLVDVGLEKSMKDPWKFLRESMLLQGDPRAAKKIVELEDMSNEFSKNLVKVMKLDINKEWIRIL